MSTSLSKSEWDHWCNEFGKSHQTKIAFCRDNNHNYHQFLYWSEKYNKYMSEYDEKKQILIDLRSGT